jgi:hypothetical protein
MMLLADFPCSWSIPVPGLAADAFADEGDAAFRIYVVKTGDTLHSIASQKIHYNDPLKWTLIYGINREEIQKLPVTPADIPEYPLPAGMTLAIQMPPSPPAQVSPHNYPNKWVITMKSSKDEKDLIPQAISVIDKGHFAYITNFKGKTITWKRLRVGFFPDEPLARKTAALLLEDTAIHDYWISKTTQKELLDYSPFAE